MNERTQKSILQMARGAIQERADYEMSRLLDNILDPNTAATAQRTLTITLKLKPGSMWLMRKPSLRWYRRFLARWLWTVRIRKPRRCSNSLKPQDKENPHAERIYCTHPENHPAAHPRG